jgi:hypothetical protein
MRYYGIPSLVLFALSENCAGFQAHGCDKRATTLYRTTFRLRLLYYYLLVTDSCIALVALALGASSLRPLLRVAPGPSATLPPCHLFHSIVASPVSLASCASSFPSSPTHLHCPPHPPSHPSPYACARASSPLPCSSGPIFPSSRHQLLRHHRWPAAASFACNPVIFPLASSLLLLLYSIATLTCLDKRDLGFIYLELNGSLAIAVPDRASIL